MRADISSIAKCSSVFAVPGLVCCAGRALKKHLAEVSPLQRCTAKLLWPATQVTLLCKEP